MDNKLDVYHFINKDYGKAYAEVYKEIGEDLFNRINLTFIYSKLNMKRIDNLIYRIKSFNRKYKIKCILDVNNEKMLANLPQNCIAFCTGFNQIFNKELIERFREFLNFHPSILPYYRGPTPSYWCIKNGEKQTGVTVHQVTKYIDRGEILYQEAVNIDPDDDEQSLDRKISLIGKEILKNYLLSKLSKSTFESKFIDAGEIYLHKVSYASFPQTDNIIYIDRCLE